MKCNICERQAEADLCQYHLEAKSKVETAYRRWVEAYGTISRKEYLELVVKNPETGEWASDAAKMLLEFENERWAAKTFKS